MGIQLSRGDNFLFEAIFTDFWQLFAKNLLHIEILIFQLSLVFLASELETMDKNIGYTNYFVATNWKSKGIVIKQKVRFFLPKLFILRRSFYSQETLFWIIEISNSWFYLVAIPVPNAVVISIQIFITFASLNLTT